MSYLQRRFICKFGKALFTCSLLGMMVVSHLAWATSIPERISFQNILENKDITMGEGASFFQDSEGYMWLGGSSALIRYDGYDFRFMDYVPNEQKPEERESVRYTESLFEDSKNRLWVASRGGLLHFDRRKDELTLVKDDPSQPQKIAGINILRIIELPSGDLLACSVAGVYQIDPVTLKYKVVVPQRVNQLYRDGDDIWLATENGLSKLHWPTQVITPYKTHRGDEGITIDHRIRDIVPDGKGKLWLATASGIVHYDPVTQQGTRYLNNINDRFSLGGNDVWRLLLDSEGVLWAATDGGGLAVFDQERQRFINHKFEAGRAGSISSNNVRTVYEDRNHDIWVGNYPVGVNFFDRSSAPFVTYTSDASNPNSLSSNAILSVQEDKDGNLWIGTGGGGGLNFYNRETGEFTRFKSDPNNPNSLNGDSVTSTFIDSQGLIWTGAWASGVGSYDPVNKQFTRYPFDSQKMTMTERISTSDRLNSSSVWFIREDKNNDLWFATHTGGISKMDRKTKMFTHYTQVGNDPESLSNNLAWTMLEDSKGNFWIGTAGGLNLMDQEKGTFKKFFFDPSIPTTLSNSSTTTLFEDSQKRLWVGTDAGLNLFDPETETFTRYTKKDGFLNDHIRKILEDKKGNLWVSTNNGFASFNPETKKIKTYNRSSGRLVGGFFTKSGLVSQRDEIIFGGSEGLRIFNPQELSENKEPPPIVLTDFKIFSDSVVVGADDGILTSAINYTESIRLDYTKSMFVLSFAALNYRDSSKNQYSYKLEGFDRDWMKPGTQRMAKYTNLDAGTYVFRVRGSNNDGVWNDEGKSITIVQLPPPWKTWWAYTLYVLIVLGILIAFVLQQLRKRQLIEEQNRLLEIKVTERTAEVRAKSKDIQAMLSNMPQGLFTVEDGGVIHPEYSNYLESIFETKNIAGCNVSEFLFSGANVGSDALASVNAAIFSIVGEHEMNFEFNKPLLMDEYDSEIHGKKKSLALDWNPITEDDVVSKLMVSVRDVTQIKQMEESAREQKRQLEIVSQLLNLSADKYLSFEHSAEKYIRANRQAIQSASSYDPDVVALLFRNMHTIKGNCRTFGFTYLSDTVHTVESTYSKLKAEEIKCWDVEKLLNDVDLVEAAVAEYAHVYHSVLGRGDGSGAVRRDGFWMNNSVMNTIRQYVKGNQLTELATLVDRVNALTLEQNLADVIVSLTSIATQIDKEPPEVLIHADHIMIKDTAQNLIRDIFAHILRNCVDHGLERADDRVAIGKNPRGTIVIDAQVKRDCLDISVRDDGVGLNIQRLFHKGIQHGIWSENDRPDIQKIAELIFHSGVSTKDEVTDISGRGVGMDAVKQFLTEAHGAVCIKLHEEQASTQEYMPFELVVSLPKPLYFVVEAAGSEE
jgi:ligand-binding sensor domain-containing protein/HPt (histidine-containing phosphotransfer) domain-containing protein